ncbi:hypothetical protein G3I59_37130 [Amycolatopsis rubida]|uniref:DUF7973 domain-containing protein n=1 Tax=Amycolatopsis rubida TaxID=112413 RepID=A0ABX0C1M9_9PSEU|nr:MULTISPECIES: hypothetical protein [Amycolatopsis]MYW96082.1 hypothetical protein [Amycolatopsis rubida]NEC61073.1 hypothetical protein [Amycolatopsis rubida]OAP23407.1 hypothetical protein A4R44_06054 [Amycolatopsis sp. M39]
MHIDVSGLVGAAAGGFLGATFGALVAFVFTGIAVLIGVAVLMGSGNSAFLDTVAFGPVFGPHISFAAGVAAVAYAHRRGFVASGRDIVTPLVSLARPSVLLVGSGFGVLGYLGERLFSAVPWFGANTNTAALAVVASAVLARLAFGRSGLVGAHADGVTGWARFVPDARHVWLSYQQKPGMAIVLGLFVGGLSAWAAVSLLAAYPHASGAIYLGFGVSAVSLLFLAFGVEVPATHHITLVSAVAAGAVVTKFSTADPLVGLAVGAAAGGATALVGEAFSRFWLIRGDTHIDPPASAIWPMTTVALAAVALFPA